MLLECSETVTVCNRYQSIFLRGILGVLSRDWIIRSKHEETLPKRLGTLCLELSDHREKYFVLCYRWNRSNFRSFQNEIQRGSVRLDFRFISFLLNASLSLSKLFSRSLQRSTLKRKAYTLFQIHPGSPVHCPLHTPRRGWEWSFGSWHFFSATHLALLLSGGVLLIPRK